MDCPSEESLIRLKLDGFYTIRSLKFDIPNRILEVYHDHEIDKIELALNNLNLHSERLGTETVSNLQLVDDSMQKKVLWTVLIINFLFFFVELVSGVLASSMGLIADSLDMLADSFVYAISLFVVGGSIAQKITVSKIAGYFQITLAIYGVFEVIRRFMSLENPPNFKTMILVSILALIANVICLLILQKSKNQEAHMKSSMIFTSNDIIINSGVILAGILVYLLNTNIPDLIIGIIVFILVIKGAIRILKLSN